MNLNTVFSALTVGALILLPVNGDANESRPAGAMQPTSNWTTFARGGAVYQFDTDLDKGGSYSSGRYNIEVGHGYGWSRRDTVSVTVSYSLDSYDFSSGSPAGIGTLAPWENIHTFSVSTPIRKGFSESWTGFFIPSLRSTGESGAKFSDTVTGGGFTGLSYKFSDSLTIGPGLGVFSQLEESATIFPVLIIKWDITEKLSLDTGRGLAATLGPGLTLSYQVDQKLRLGIGARYEKLRFRLDEDGDIANGVGEDASFPIFANCTYNFSPKSSISLVGGLETGGELTVENSEGNTITEEDSDPGFFTGLTFNARF